MKKISEGRRKRPILSCFRRLLTPVLLAAFLMAAVLMLTTPGQANDEESGPTWQQSVQETGGYWQRVDTIVVPIPDEGKYGEYFNHNVVCGTYTNSLSEGSFTHKSEWYQGEKCYKNSANFNAETTWSRPPERITPGTPVSLDIKVNATINMDVYHHSGHLGLSIYERFTQHGPYSTVCNVSVNVSEFFVYDKSDIWVQEEECVYEARPGYSADDQVILQYHSGTGSSSTGGGYMYIYQWVPAEEKPAAPGPAEAEEPVPDPPKPDPPKADDSEPDTGYQRPSSSDSGSGGSVLGPLAVLGGLTGVAVMGGLAVLGGAGAIAIGIKVLGGGGGAAAASVTAGKPYVGDEVAEQVADLVEPTEEKLDLKDKPPEITRENLENEIQKELERLAEEGHYIGNKTILQKGLNIGASNWISDKVFGRTKNYCEEMKDLGKAHLEKIMPEGTIIEHVALQRNRLMNHIANRVILPDGTELVIDYWEGLANNKPAVYTVKEWKEKWKKELGEPMHGRYEIDDVVSQGQKMMFDHVIKNGYDKIDEFSTNTLTPKEVETIKNWARREDWESYETWDNVRNSMTHEEWDDWKTVYLYKKRLGVVPKNIGGAR